MFILALKTLTLALGLAQYPLHLLLGPKHRVHITPNTHQHSLLPLLRMPSTSSLALKTLFILPLKKLKKKKNYKKNTHSCPWSCWGCPPPPPWPGTPCSWPTARPRAAWPPQTGRWTRGCPPGTWCRAPLRTRRSWGGNHSFNKLHIFNLTKILHNEVSFLSFNVSIIATSMLEFILPRFSTASTLPRSWRKKSFI